MTFKTSKTQIYTLDYTQIISWKGQANGLIHEVNNPKLIFISLDGGRGLAQSSVGSIRSITRIGEKKGAMLVGKM